jgi:hypothetical protein
MAAFSSCLSLREKEPVYEGRTLAAWLDEEALPNPVVRERARRAVREIRKETVTNLVKKLEFRESKFRIAIRDWAIHHKLLTDAANARSAIFLHLSATSRLASLGPDAEPAIPALISLLDEDTGAEVALGRIGPKAFLPLAVALTNIGPGIRLRAMKAMSVICEDLLQEDGVSSDTARILGAFEPNAKQAEPGLRLILGRSQAHFDSDLELRLCAAAVLRVTDRNSGATLSQ